MKCAQARGFLSEFTSGQMTEVELQGFLKHTEQCDSCRQMLLAERNINNLIRKAVDQDAPSSETLIDRIRERIRADEAISGYRRTAYFKFFVAVVLITVALWLAWALVLRH